MYEQIKKILIIGEGGVGKTAFVLKYCKGEFKTETKWTYVFDFFTKIVNINNVKIKLLIRDFAGPSRYRFYSYIYQFHMECFYFPNITYYIICSIRYIMITKFITRKIERFIIISPVKIINFIINHWYPRSKPKLK